MGSREHEKNPATKLLDALLPARLEPGAAPDPDTIERLERWLRPLSTWFRTEVEGAEHLPAGGALLVSNHGPMGFDATELVFGVYRQTGRMPRGLAEWNFFRVPFVKSLLERAGHLAGTRENAVTALQGGDLVLVYPGGAREALKGERQRYQLIWEKARGFVKVALRAGVPIVPVAGIGVDDYYKVLREPEDMAETPLGKLITGALGHSKYAFPALLGLGPVPLPTKLRFVIGEPISLDHPPEAADDPEVVEALREEVRSVLEQKILTHLIRRL
jgi:1-acyl-sn-glycerol-3-phosphate acyltransferase